MSKLKQFNSKQKRSAAAAVGVSVLLFWGSLSASAAQPQVELGTAESFAVLAGSGITNTGTTTVTGTAGGDMGSHPTPAFTGSSLVTTNGTKYLAGEPAVANAKSDLLTAYNDAAGRTPVNTVAGDLGGQTLVAGVYNSASSLALTGTLTLDAENDPDAVFIFQAGSTLTTATSSTVSLINGAQACNVYWQVGSSATIGTTSDFVGSILAQTSITANNSASFNGQLLALNGAVTLDANTITNDACVTVAEPEPTPEPEPEPTPEPEPAPEEEVEEEEVAAPGVEAPEEEAGTVDGGELPDTDTNNWLLVLGAGILVIALGGFLLLRTRRNV